MNEFIGAPCKHGLPTSFCDKCEIESLRAQLGAMTVDRDKEARKVDLAARQLAEAQSGEAEEAAYLCSNCGPIAHTEVDALDQTLGCTRCNGVMWGDDGITIEPLYTSPPATKVPEAKKLPELMMAQYHEAMGWNACRQAMLAAQEGEK